MLEAIGSHHKSRHTHTNIFIVTCTHFSFCQTFKSLWRIHIATTNKTLLYTSNFFFLFFYFIQWFYVHCQLLCVFASAHNIVIVISLLLSFCLYFFSIFINYPFKLKIFRVYASWLLKINKQNQWSSPKGPTFIFHTDFHSPQIHTHTHTYTHSYTHILGKKNHLKICRVANFFTRTLIFL